MSRGPVWGAASEDLNATILVWPAGEGPAAHVNESRDVLYVVVEGTVELTVDDETHALRQGDARLASATRTVRVTARLLASLHK